MNGRIAACAGAFVAFVAACAADVTGPGASTDGGGGATGATSSSEGSTATTANATGASTTTSTTGTSMESACTDYCDVIMTACIGAHAVYPSTDVCLHTCAILPAGMAGAQSGNSVACRLGKALDALQAADPTMCPAAGPGGTSVCGSDCDGYCSILMVACAGVTNILDAGACIEACSLYATTGNFSLPATGDTLECRLAYACAASLDPAANCANADTNSPACQ